MPVDDVDQLLEQQEIRRDDAQARTDHDAVVRTSGKCISEHRFCGFAIVNIQSFYAIAERFQFGAVSLNSGANLCRRKPWYW
jgi:hypothetical protein